MKKEELTALYERLTKLKELDEEGNVYGGSASNEADWYVLDSTNQLIMTVFRKQPDIYLKTDMASLLNATITHYLILMNFLKAKSGLPNGLVR